MTIPIQPIFLFADSQLLFWKHDGVPFLHTVRSRLPANPKAAYVGASNGDIAAFFDLFVAAMENIGIAECRMIMSAYSAEDSSFLEQADLILLAGGDVETGWNTLHETGMAAAVVKRYHEGAVLIGTSAGAVQLGLYGYKDTGPASTELFDTFKLVPLIIGAHDERDGWSRLGTTIALLGSGTMGIGLSTGGGAIWHPDDGLEPVRFSVNVFTLTDGRLHHSLSLPQGFAGSVEASSIKSSGE